LNYLRNAALAKMGIEIILFLKFTEKMLLYH